MEVEGDNTIKAHSFNMHLQLAAVAYGCVSTQIENFLILCNAIVCISHVICALEN